MFNKKIVSAVSVLLCGVFMLSVVWEPSTVKAKGSARHSATAGIVSALADAENTNGNATAGIVTALSVNVDDAGALYAQESGNQAVSSTVEEYGYTNMGIAILSEGGNLNVREEPSTDGHIVGKLPDKGGCEVLSIEDGWAKISSGKVEGYVSTEFLKTGEEAVALANELAQLRQHEVEIQRNIRILINSLSDFWKGQSEEALVANFNNKQAQMDEILRILQEFIDLANDAADKANNMDHTLAQMLAALFR